MSVYHRPTFSHYGRNKKETQTDITAGLRLSKSVAGVDICDIRIIYVCRKYELIHIY